MLKQAFVVAALLATAPMALAQTDCSKPVVKGLRNGQEIPATGAPLPPRMTLQVTSESGCPNQGFIFRNAELTLVRHGRPVMPAKSVSGSKVEVNLSEWMRVYQPGDRLHAFIPYQNILIVSADGKRMPYPRPKSALPKQGQLDLRTDEAKGISFAWALK